MSEPSSTIIPYREVALVMLVIVASLLFLSMFSYSALDASWSYAGSDLRVTNLVGYVGAWSADIAYVAIGWVAYVVPFYLIVLGARLLFGNRHRLSWALLSIRIVGSVFIVISSSVLVNLYVDSSDALPAGPGGILGNWLVNLGLPFLNLIGLTLIAAGLLSVGIQAGFGISWIRVAEVTGRLITVITSKVFIVFKSLVRVARSLIQKCSRGFILTYRTFTGQKKISYLQGNKYASKKTIRRESDPKKFLDLKKDRKLSRKSESLSASNPKLKKRNPTNQYSVDETLPTLGLLEDAEHMDDGGNTKESLVNIGQLLEVKLLDFGVTAEVVSVLPGPVVTRFEIQPAAGIKVSKISGLAKDLARSLAVVSVRIVEVIPGKSVVGIEIPNEKRETVRLKEVLGTRAYEEANSPITLALGKDIAGAPVMTDIAKMPHLLIAGTTGSGKSVGVNAMLLSMLYKATPDQLRLILVDPKMLELAVYDGIPHLLTPVVTDMKEAAHSLNWCIGEMERRYRLMAALGVRNLAGYNKRIQEAHQVGKPITDPFVENELEDAQELAALPFIVVVIDEFADMMMVVGKKVEQQIARLAQKARAAGIHLVLATQRPSVDVITGLIKANIPARISFQVSSRVDSRTILDQGGAEQLLGHGDMLFMPPGSGIPTRVHGAFVSDEEVHAVVSDWKTRGEPDYLEEVLVGVETTDVPGTVELGDHENSEPLYDEAVAFVLDSRKASISAVQRKMRIGYNRAARLIETMEEAGVISAMNSNGSREVLVPTRE